MRRSDFYSDEDAMEWARRRGEYDDALRSLYKFGTQAEYDQLAAARLKLEAAMSKRINLNPPNKKAE